MNLRLLILVSLTETSRTESFPDLTTLKMTHDRRWTITPYHIHRNTFLKQVMGNKTGLNLDYLPCINIASIVCVNNKSCPSMPFPDPNTGYYLRNRFTGKYLAIHLNGSIYTPYSDDKVPDKFHQVRLAALWTGYRAFKSSSGYSSMLALRVSTFGVITPALDSSTFPGTQGLSVVLETSA